MRGPVWMLISILFAVFRTISAHAAESKEFEGLYLNTFENSAFHPCDSDEIWWLSATEGELYSALRPVRPESGSYVHLVRIVGTLSGYSENGFGHLGMYDQEIVVSEVVSSQLADDGIIRQCRGVGDAEFEGHP